MARPVLRSLKPLSQVDVSTDADPTRLSSTLGAHAITDPSGLIQSHPVSSSLIIDPSSPSMPPHTPMKVEVPDDFLPPGYKRYQRDFTKFALSKVKGGSKDDGKKHYLDLYETPGGKTLKSRSCLLLLLNSSETPAEHIALVQRGLVSDGFVKADNLPEGWMTRPSTNTHRYNHLYVTEDGKTMRGKAAVTKYLDAATDAEAEKNLLAFLNASSGKRIGDVVKVEGLPKGWSVRKAGSGGILIISESGNTFTRVTTAVANMIMQGAITEKEGPLLTTKVSQAVTWHKALAGYEGVAGRKRLRVAIEPLDTRRFGHVVVDDDGTPTMKKMKAWSGAAAVAAARAKANSTGEDVRDGPEGKEEDRRDTSAEEGKEMEADDGEKEEEEENEVKVERATAEPAEREEDERPRKVVNAARLPEAFLSMETDTKKRLGKVLHDNPGLVASVAGGNPISKLFKDFVVKERADQDEREEREKV
jgi:hypothetical protein